MKIGRLAGMAACALGLAALGLTGPSGTASADDVGAETVEIEKPAAALPAEEPEEEEEEEEREPNDFLREGWYLQAQFAYGLENFDVGFAVDNALGGNMAAGYRFHPLGAMELEFEYLDQFAYKNTSSQINRTFNVSFNGRLYPLGTLFEPDSLAARFQPFLKVGPAWMWIQEKNFDGKNNDGDLAGRFGAGMDFYITQHIVATLYANYMLPIGGPLGDYQYASGGIGFKWRFGSPDY